MHNAQKSIHVMFVVYVCKFHSFIVEANMRIS